MKTNAGGHQAPHPALVPIVATVAVVGALSFAIISVVTPDPNERQRPTNVELAAASPASNLPTPDDPVSLTTRPAVTEPARTRPDTTFVPTGVAAPPLHDRSEALEALSPAVEAAKACSNGTVRRVRVVVAFGRDGKVEEVKPVDPVGDDAVEACVLAAFRPTRLRPFQGRPFSVVRSVVFDDVE